MFLLDYDVISCIYFLFINMAFGMLIPLINETHLKKNTVIYFSIATTIIVLCLSYMFSISNLILFKLLHSMIIFINCKYILKTNTFSTLIITLLYSVIVFWVNVFTLSFNVSINSNFHLLYQTFIFTLIIAIFYGFLYNLQEQKDTFYKLKDYMSENLEVCFFLLILTHSYDFSAISTKPNMYLLAQVIIITFLFLSIKNQIKFKKLLNINRALKLENEKNKQLLDNIRVFKHDYSNTICSLGGYISLNDMKGLKKFYSKLTEDLTTINNLQTINNVLINEPSLYNLFASKHKIIIKNKLRFDFYSTINYKKLYISAYELSKILGIFIDNAIEAAKLTNEKEIFISCETLKNKKQQFIIKNSYNNKDINIDKIYKKGYSSKEIKSGLGLWEVSNIIKDNPNLTLSTEKDSKYFIQKLTISNKVT